MIGAKRFQLISVIRDVREAFNCLAPKKTAPLVAATRISIYKPLISFSLV